MTNITEIVEDLKRAEAALGDPLDIPRSTRAFEEYWRSRRAFANTVRGLVNVLNDLARERAFLGDLESRRVEDLDARIKESNERIERLRAQLAAHLLQAEALLAEPVTQ